MSFKTIGQVANYKPLYSLGMEELAARQRRIEPSGGILFVRTTERLDKDAARGMVIDLFHPDRWPGYLHMLTMPSLNWRFERLLLATREEGWMRAPKPRRTFFTTVENDRSIYFAAAAQMPGSETPDRVIRHIRRADIKFAECGVKTRFASFFFADIDDLLRKENWSSWDAVWLDYTSPLTIERLHLIRKLFEARVRDTLIVTALKARWNRQTSNAIGKAGGHSRWLRQHLPGEILHDIEYFDTVPMAQFAVRHPIENLGQFDVGAHLHDAEIAVGHSFADAHVCGADGTNANDLGQSLADAHALAAEIAAVGQGMGDAQQSGADGGINLNDLSQGTADAHSRSAEIAAAGHGSYDAHGNCAGGGANSNDLGHHRHGTHRRCAEIAVVGQQAADTRSLLADGGTHQTKEQPCPNPKNLALKPKRPPQKKQQQLSKSGSPQKNAKPSQQASRRHSRPLKKLGKRSALAKLAKKSRANKTKRNSKKISANPQLISRKSMPRMRRRPQSV